MRQTGHGLLSFGHPRKVDAKPCVRFSDWPKYKARKFDFGLALLPWLGDNCSASTFRHARRIEGLGWRNRLPFPPALSLLHVSISNNKIFAGGEQARFGKSL